MQRANNRRWGQWLFTALALAVLITFSAALLPANPAVGKVTATISLLNSKRNDPSNVAIWLDPLVAVPKGVKPPAPPAIHQKGKKFVPRVVIANVGQEVSFPNDDPFPHNIFSNSEVKKFDLGLYQAGESRSLPLTRAGVIPIYCNIHPQMQAFLVVVKTPYFALSSDKGDVVIDGVPAGKYTLHVWHERAKADVLDGLSRQITVSGVTNVGKLEIDEAGAFGGAHKNKDGKDYSPGN